MQSLKMRSQHRRGGIIGGLLKLLGLAAVLLVALIVLAARSARQPDPMPPATPARIVPPTPTPAPPAPNPAIPVATAKPSPAPSEDIRFGLTEQKRAEIHNCLWQGGEWATAEAERVFPMDKLGEVSDNGNDRPARST
jgi:hypothetical protein